jgi:hypothetical protein
VLATEGTLNPHLRGARGPGEGMDWREREEEREREAAPGCGEVHAKVGADLTLQFYWVR